MRTRNAYSLRATNSDTRIANMETSLLFRFAYFDTNFFQ